MCQWEEEDIWRPRKMKVERKRHSRRTRSQVKIWSDCFNLNASIWYIVLYGVGPKPHSCIQAGVDKLWNKLATLHTCGGAIRYRNHEWEGTEGVLRQGSLSFLVYSGYLYMYVELLVLSSLTHSINPSSSCSTSRVEANYRVALSLHNKNRDFIGSYPSLIILRSWNVTLISQICSVWREPRMVLN